MALDLIDLARLSSPSYVVAVFILLAIISTAAYGLYNVHFHPLNRFPGPKIWAAYRLTSVIAANRGELPHRVLDLHRKYGDVVRIAPDELAFTGPTARDEIQGLLPDRRQNPKDLHIYGPYEPGNERSIIHAGDVDHARLRRIYGVAFTTKALEEQKALLYKYADLLVKCLKDAIDVSPNQDLNAWYNYCTFDFMGELAFAERFRCLDDPESENRAFVRFLFAGAYMGQQIGQLQRYGIWSTLKHFLPSSLFKANVDMNNYTADLTKRRTERGYIPGKTDVFNYLLQNKKAEDRLTPDELARNGLILVVAGSETTATFLSGVSYHLCRNPEAYRKVIKEVRSAYKTGGEIDVRTVMNLSYMQAVISEIMRIFPPSPFGFPRMIVTEGGQKAYCSVFHYAAYRSGLNFARPDEFLPERWLDNRPSEFKNDARHVLQPFNSGPRGCLGKQLANVESSLLLAKMLWHFDFELADPEDYSFEHLKGSSIWRRQPLNIRVTAAQR